MFRHLGDLLTIKILKGRIKNLYCQNRDILGFCENYLKLLHALYNCVANIISFIMMYASLESPFDFESQGNLNIAMWG